MLLDDKASATGCDVRLRWHSQSNCNCRAARDISCAGYQRDTGAPPRCSCLTHRTRWAGSAFRSLSRQYRISSAERKYRTARRLSLARMFVEGCRTKRSRSTLKPAIFFKTFFKKFCSLSPAICGGLRWRIRGPVLGALVTPVVFIWQAGGRVHSPEEVIVPRCLGQFEPLA
jgi:hypothetical protein